MLSSSSPSAVSAASGQHRAFGGIEQLVEGASFVFLLIFALVNWIAIHRRAGNRAMAMVGLIGALPGTVMLVAYLTGLV